MAITTGNDGYSAKQKDGTVREANFVVALNPDGTYIGSSVTNSPDKAEDAAHVSGDVGSFALAVRTPTVAVALTSTDGDYSPIAANQYGNLKVDLVDSTGTELTYLSSINGGTPVTLTGNSFLNIPAGQATTTVKSGSGVLYSILFNGPATATSTMVIYDNTAASGTVIGRPLATAIVGPTVLSYGGGLAFSTGLTIITATANGADMTVVYR